MGHVGGVIQPDPGTYRNCRDRIQNEVRKPLRSLVEGFIGADVRLVLQDDGDLAAFDLPGIQAEDILDQLEYIAMLRPL